MKRLAAALTLLGLPWLGLALAASSAPPTLQAATLRPTFGGVLLEARLGAHSSALNGIWADTGRANLMHCAPSCAIVSEIPLATPVLLSQTSVYRVVLGGNFRPRQNVKLLLRFAKGDTLTVSVPVAGK